MDISVLPSEDDYHALIESTSSSDEAVIIEFSAGACRACEAMEPKLLKFASSWSQVRWFNIVYEDNPKLFKSLNVRVLPYFEIVSSGRKLDGFPCGPKRIERIAQKLEEHGIRQPFRPWNWHSLRRQLQLGPSLRFRFWRRRAD